MPGPSTIDVRTVEVSIKSSADKATTSLESLAKKLDQVGSIIENVVSKANGLATVGKFDTGNISEVLNAAKELGKTMAEITKKEQTIKVNSKTLDKANATLEAMFEKMRGRTTLDLGNNFKDAQTNVKLWERSLDRAQKQFDEFVSQGAKGLKTKGFETAVENIVNFTNAIEMGKDALADWNGYMASLKTDPGDIVPGLEGQTNTYDYGNAAQAAQEATSATEEYVAAEEEASATEERRMSIMQRWLSLLHVKRWETAEDTAEEEEATEAVKSRISISRRLSMIMREIGDATKFSTNALRRFISGLKAMANPIRTVKNLFSRFGESIGLGGGRGGLFRGRSMGQFIGLMLFRRAFMAVIRALVNGIKEGSDNLTQYSAEYNHSISMVTSALSYLKNAWAAAFAPIINVVAPYLEAFINMLAGALNAIGRFMAVLTGKGFAVQAKQTWADYAASLDKTAGSTGSANKAAEAYKKTLMSFDQIHALNEPKSSSGSGGGGGGGNSGGLSVTDMFETVAVEGALAEFGSALREAILNEDWVGVGSLIAQKLNEKLANKESWEQTGKDIAGFLNKGIDITLGFNSTFDFGQLGSNIGAAIQGFLNDFHWENLGASAGHFTNGMFNLLKGAMTEINWRQLGENIKLAIKSYFETLKWDDIGSTITTAFESLLDLCIGLMPDFGSIMEYAYQSIIDFIDGSSESWSKELGAKLALFLVEAFENMMTIMNPHIVALNKVIEAITGEDLLGELDANTFGQVKEYLKGIIETEEEMRKKTLEVGEAAKTSAKDGLDAAETQRDTGKKTLEEYGVGANQQKETLYTTFKNIGTKLKEFFTGKVDARSTGIGIMDSIRGGANWSRTTGGVQTSFGNMGSEIGKSTKTGADGKGTGQGILSSILEGAKSWIGNITSAFQTYGSDTVKKFNYGFQTTPFAKLHYNATKENINGHQVTTKLDPVTTTVKLKVAAKGGLFDQGELILAREAGPEMIGRIGHRTAVANNDQIVAAIEGGVARGMMAAMSASGGNSGSAPYEIHVVVKTQNDEVLARAVERGQAKRRYRLGMA